MKILCAREQQIFKHFWVLNVWTSWILTSSYKQECEHEQNQFFSVFFLEFEREIWIWKRDSERAAMWIICMCKQEKNSLQKSFHLRSALLPVPFS